jgi:hypothetical protein
MAPRVLSQKQGICQDWPRLARFLDISWHIHNLENAMFQTWKSPGYFFNDTQHLIQVTIIIIIIDMTNQKDRHESDFPAKRKTTHIILRWFDSCFSCWVAQTFSTPARPCFWQAWAFRLAIGIPLNRPGGPNPMPDGTSWLNTLSLWSLWMITISQSVWWLSHPSEKYESVGTGWWNSQYMEK